MNAMYAVYAFCREADDIVDEGGADVQKSAELHQLRLALEGRPQPRVLREGADVARPRGAAEAPAARGDRADLYSRLLHAIYDVLGKRVAVLGWRKATLGIGTWVRARLKLPLGR